MIDFEKAFDRVDRNLLWARLRDRGLSGQMLSAIRRCYDKVQLRVKVNGKRGERFESVQGVKQGGPLSPVLFGLFIESFADYVDEHEQRQPRGGVPTARGKGVPELLYADDLTLMTMNRERMQFLLDRLAEFCDAFGMNLNVGKCELMVFAGRQTSYDALLSHAAGLRYAGQTVPVKERAKHLGLRYGCEFTRKGKSPGLSGAQGTRHHPGWLPTFPNAAHMSRSQAETRQSPTVAQQPATEVCARSAV